MDEQLNKYAYDPESGFAVKPGPSRLFEILDELVSNHLGLDRTIGSYKPSHYQLLDKALNKFGLNSRESRTLPKHSCKLVSNALISELALIMPTPKR